MYSILFLVILAFNLFYLRSLSRSVSDFNRSFSFFMEQFHEFLELEKSYDDV